MSYPSNPVHDAASYSGTIHCRPTVHVTFVLVTVTLPLVTRLSQSLVGSHVQVCVACLGMAAACGLLMRAESRAESQLVLCGLELDPSLTNPWTGLIGVPTIGLLAGILLRVHLSSTCTCTDHVAITDTAFQALVNSIHWFCSCRPHHVSHDVAMAKQTQAAVKCCEVL